MTQRVAELEKANSEVKRDASRKKRRPRPKPPLNPWSCPKTKKKKIVHGQTEAAIEKRGSQSGRAWTKEEPGPHAPNLTVSVRQLPRQPDHVQTRSTRDRSGLSLRGNLNADGTNEVGQVLFPTAWFPSLPRSEPILKGFRALWRA